MFLGLLAAVGLPRPVEAKVFYSRAGAMKLAFPRATSVERKHIYPTTEQLARIAKLCRCKPPGKLLTVYVGHRDGKTLGYAYIDTHRVRTLPETFMVVLDPSGKVQGVHILAFHEPPEYMPPPRWLAQFQGRRGARTYKCGLAAPDGRSQVWRARRSRPTPSPARRAASW